jgi:hypothetical protein
MAAMRVLDARTVDSKLQEEDVDGPRLPRGVPMLPLPMAREESAESGKRLRTDVDGFDTGSSSDTDTDEEGTESDKERRRRRRRRRRQAKTPSAKRLPRHGACPLCHDLSLAHCLHFAPVPRTPQAGRLTAAGASVVPR